MISWRSQSCRLLRRASLDIGSSSTDKSIFTHIRKPQKSWIVQLFFNYPSKKVLKGLNCYLGDRLGGLVPDSVAVRHLGPNGLGAYRGTGAALVSAGVLDPAACLSPSEDAQ